MLEAVIKEVKKKQVALDVHEVKAGRVSVQVQERGVSEAPVDVPQAVVDFNEEGGQEAAVDVNEGNDDYGSCSGGTMDGESEGHGAGDEGDLDLEEGHVHGPELASVESERQEGDGEKGAERLVEFEPKVLPTKTLPAYHIPRTLAHASYYRSKAMVMPPNPYHVYNPFLPTSTQDSEIQSQSSGATDSMSIPDSASGNEMSSTFKGAANRPASKNEIHRQRHHMKQNILANKDTANPNPNPMPIPRADRLNPPKGPQPSDTEAFAALLITKLNKVKHEQDMRKNLGEHLKPVEEYNGESNSSAIIQQQSGGNRFTPQHITDAIQAYFKLNPVEESDQAILDQHISRLSDWGDTPTRTPGCASPCGGKPPPSYHSFSNGNRGNPTVTRSSARAVPSTYRDRDAYRGNKTGEDSLHPSLNSTNQISNSSSLPLQSISEKVIQWVGNGPNAGGGPDSDPSKRKKSTHCMHSGTSLSKGSKKGLYSMGSGSRSGPSDRTMRVGQGNFNGSGFQGMPPTLPRAYPSSRGHKQPVGLLQSSGQYEQQQREQLNEVRRKLEDTTLHAFKGKGQMRQPVGQETNSFKTLPTRAKPSYPVATLPPTGSAAGHDVTIINYRYSESAIPFRIKLPGVRGITLKQFKQNIPPKKGSFRYFFKTEDIHDKTGNNGAVNEEVSDENAVLPYWNGQITATIESI